MRIIGLDIGGANLKAADNDGRCVSRAFEIWRSPQTLANELAQIISKFASCDCLAVTMTAELADCFETKSQGVDFILSAVERAAQGVPIGVWQTGGEFVTPEIAREIPLLVAAANWHAQATWVGRMVPEGGALLIDIGTTTTDVIPLSDGVPVAAGLTDSERLQAGELVYTGIRRTPICAITQIVPFRGAACPLAAELFATTLDVYLLLGKIDEDATDCHTANGRPATKAAAHDRIARMLCCDRTELAFDEARRIAQHVALQQRLQIATAIDQVLAKQEGSPNSILLSGSGAFLADDVASNHPILKSVPFTRLCDVLGPELSAAACAYAVARLGSEQLV